MCMARRPSQFRSRLFLSTISARVETSVGPGSSVPLGFTKKMPHHRSRSRSPVPPPCDVSDDDVHHAIAGAPVHDVLPIMPPLTNAQLLARLVMQAADIRLKCTVFLPSPLTSISKHKSLKPLTNRILGADVKTIPHVNTWTPDSGPQVQTDFVSVGFRLACRRLDRIQRCASSPHPHRILTS